MAPRKTAAQKAAEAAAANAAVDNTSQPEVTDTPAYEPEEMYELTLSRKVELPNGRWLMRGHRNTVKGKLIAALGDAVIDAVKVL